MENAKQGDRFLVASLLAALLAVFGLAGVLAPAAHADLTQLDDGTYSVPVTLGGGSGRASLVSPATLEVKDGQTTATIVWSSSNYDKMTVEKTDYAPTTTDGGSTFQIPVTDDAMKVKAETTAMGTPHTIDYTIAFDMGAAQAADSGGVSMTLVVSVIVVLLVIGIAIGVVASRRKARR